MNLLELPAGPRHLMKGFGLNQWMGFAQRWGGGHAIAAHAIENGIRIGIPAAVGGSAYGGYQIGKKLAE